MRVHPVPCLRDNYAYLVHREDSDQCVVVDPSETRPVTDALRRHGLTLTAILNTHHHWDHVGGNEDLADRHPGLPIYGHASDRGRIPRQTHFLEHGDHITVAGLEFDILHIPGHTMGAIAYVGEGLAFTGDTLFAAGCGRLFEGTPKNMYESLNVVLGELSDETLVYCGHEYTQNNLSFAASLEPDNAAIRSQAEKAAFRLAEGRPTIPTTLSEERRTNPFLRCSEPTIALAVGLRAGADPTQVLGLVREAKDVF